MSEYNFYSTGSPLGELILDNSSNKIEWSEQERPSTPEESYPRKVNKKKKEEQKESKDRSNIPGLFNAIKESLKRDKTLQEVYTNISELEPGTFPIFKATASFICRGESITQNILLFKFIEYPDFCATVMGKGFSTEFLAFCSDDEIEKILEPIFDSLEDKLEEIREMTDTDEDITSGIGACRLLMGDKDNSPIVKHLEKRNTWEYVFGDENPKTGNRVSLFSHHIGE